jgi:hypothetical protein
MSWIDRTVAGLDRVDDRAWLGVNVMLFGFVLLAHGGALLLMRLQPEAVPPGFGIVYLTVPLAIVLLLVGAVGFASARWRRPVLKVHAAALGLLMAWLTWFVVDVLAHGIPAGTRFSWTPFLYTAMVFYTCLFLRRTFASAAQAARWRALPFWAAGVAAVLDMTVMARVIQMFASMANQGRLP